MRRRRMVGGARTRSGDWRGREDGRGPAQGGVLVAWLKKLDPAERPETWKLVVFYSIVAIFVIGLMVHAAGRGA